jgi:hypothetical protein
MLMNHLAYFGGFDASHEALLLPCLVRAPRHGMALRTAIQHLTKPFSPEIVCLLCLNGGPTNY